MITTPDHPLTQAERMSVISGIALTLFVSAIVQSIVGPALPTIGYELRDVEYLPWTITAYLATATAVTPLYGRLSDIYGRREMLFLSLGLFILGSVLCALSPSVFTLSLSRAVQGLGGGGLISLAQAVIGDIFPPRDRGLYQGYLSAAFSGANISGPILGGLFTQYLDWSLIFWINLPLGLVAVALMDRSLRRLPRRRSGQSLDVTGTVLLAVASISLMFILTWGGVRHPWLSAEILGLIALCAATTSLFIAHTLRAENPLMPLEVLRNPVIAPIALSNFFTMFAIIGLAAYLPVYYQLVHGLSPGAAGMALLAPTFGSLIGNWRMGKVMGHLESPKRIAIILLAVAVVAMTLLAMTAGQAPFWVVEVLLAITSCATGAMFPIGTVSTQNAAERHHLGVAVATLNFIRTIGAAVGGAVCGTLVLGSGNSAISDLLERGVTSGTALEGVTPVFALMFSAIAISVALSLLFLLLMENRPLRSTV